MNERTHEILPSPKKPSSFLTFHWLVATKLPKKEAALGIQSCSEGHFKLGTILSQCATLSSQSTSGGDFT
jgi:hypothetical protein